MQGDDARGVEVVLVVVVTVPGGLVDDVSGDSR